MDVGVLEVENVMHILSFAAAKCHGEPEDRNFLYGGQENYW